jgi:hypothetical protein
MAHTAVAAEAYMRLSVAMRVYRRFWSCRSSVFDTKCTQRPFGSIDHIDRAGAKLDFNKLKERRSVRWIERLGKIDQGF